MWDKIKKGVLFIGTPVLFVCGYIYYLWTQEDKLKSELNQAQQDKQMQGIKTQEAKAKDETDKAVGSLGDAIAKYERDKQSRPNN